MKRGCDGPRMPIAGVEVLLRARIAADLLVLARRLHPSLGEFLGDVASLIAEGEIGQEVPLA